MSLQCRSRWWSSKDVKPGRWLTRVFLTFLVLLISSQAQSFAQGGVVGGIVLSERTMAPIAGAQVNVVGTERGMVTGNNGRFLIPGLTGDRVEIEVSMIGYRTLRESVNVGTADLRIILSETAITLDEIVVTGTAGGTERRAIGNVVTRVRASEAVDMAPIPNMQSLINARAPGVVITPATGMIGSGSQIRIRGSSSFSLSNQPLLYVDGVRVDNAQATGHAVQAFSSSVISRINDFNPDDIESIEIIKGPAAATLYGTEAAHGVIHIITKRGTEGTAVWDLTVRQGANWFMDAENRVPTNYWRNPATGEVESVNFYSTEKARGTPIFRTGHVQDYMLSLSGGSPGVRYYVAGHWDGEEGAEWDNRMRRSGARANLTLTPSDKVELVGSMGYVGARYYLSCEAGCGGVTWTAFYSTPEHLQNDDRRRGGRSNPPEVYRETTRFQDLGRFTGSLQINHRPTSWFTQRLTFGIDEVREDNQTITEKTPLYLEWNPTGRGGKTVSRRDVSYNTLDYSGTFNLELNPTVTAQTSFGAQYYRRFTKSVTAEGADFATPGLKIINAAAETFGYESYTENVTLGLFVQQQFGLNERLFLTAALRADDNSAFGDEFSLVYYPKASATWVINEEPFWSFDHLSSLRLRTSYGQSGQQPGAFDALRTFNPVAGEGDVSTITPGTVGNPNLGPERASEFEIGFDAGILDDRVGFEFTWFNKTTRDAILLRPVAPSTGFPGSRFVNVGEVANRGYELALTASPVSTPRVKWDATFSLAHTLNEVKHLVDGEDAIVESAAYGIEHRIGYPLGAWFHHRVVDAEFDSDGRVINSSMICDDGKGGTTPCYDGNTIVAPRIYLGTSEPKYEGAFSSTLMLGDRIRIYGLIDFKTGFKKWDHVMRIRCSLYHVCHENAAPLEYVDTAPGRLASYQNAAEFGAAYIQDADFAKLREISVTYLIPDEWAGRIGASRASITMAGRNLHTWTNYTGLDPEGRFMSRAFGGVEQNNLPQLASFVTSINVSF